MTAASRRLGVPKSTVSRRVKRLEETLGLSLVSRSPNRVRLTPQGELLRDRCAPALNLIGDAERALHGLASEPTGMLRLTTLEVMGHAPSLTRILLEFRHRHPRIELDVVATDRVLDFDEARIDLALRPVQTGLTGNDGALRERVLSRLHSGIYATPRYQEPAGLPIRAGCAIGAGLSSLRHPPARPQFVFILRAPTGKRLRRGHGRYRNPGRRRARDRPAVPLALS